MADFSFNRGRMTEFEKVLEMSSWGHLIYKTLLNLPVLCLPIGSEDLNSSGTGAVISCRDLGVRSGPRWPPGSPERLPRRSRTKRPEILTEIESRHLTLASGTSSITGTTGTTSARSSSASTNTRSFFRRPIGPSNWS